MRESAIMTPFDLHIIMFLQNHGKPFEPIATLLYTISSFPSLLLLLLIALLTYNYKETLRTTLYIIATFMLATIIQLNFRIVAPFITETTIRYTLPFLPESVSAFALPSTAISLGAMLFFIALRKRKSFWHPTVLGVLLPPVALSHLYSGVATLTGILTGIVTTALLFYALEAIVHSESYALFQKMESRYKIGAATMFSLMITLGGLSNLALFNNLTHPSPTLYFIGKNTFIAAGLFGGVASSAILLLSRYTPFYKKRIVTKALMAILFAPFIIGISLLLYKGITLIASQLFGSSFIYTSLLYATYVLFYLTALLTYYITFHIAHKLGLITFTRTKREKP